MRVSRDFDGVAPGGAEIRPDAGGFLMMTLKGIEEDFAQDLFKAERKILAATQGPTNGAAFDAKLTSAAWKTKPTWYVVAANDPMIASDLERQFAKTMKAKTITVPSSHVPMLSHAQQVAKLIMFGSISRSRS